jgi:cell division transport system permease protein
MRFIKQHISLIFPMVAILLGLEFFIAFDRTTKGYEESLKNSYSMLVVSKDEMDIDDFRAWDKHIYKVSEIEKSKIIKEVGLDLKNRYIDEELPNFYSIKLDKYLNTQELEQVKKNLLKSDSITRVESFDTLHNSNYGLFSSIKLAFRTFIFFMTVIGFFLIIKQMEVWHLLHSERMKIMDILGASLFLRSKDLIVMALIDAIISAIIASITFYIIQNSWVKGNHIAILEDNIDGLFSFNDIFTLSFASILIVLVAVVIVVLRIKEE